ncbi:MAG: SsrA-binding protein SmpB [Verrucomicrobiia bacterium]
MSGTTEILNRKARRDYHIEDTVETGIELTGTEVKSLRTGQANLNDAFARVEKGELWLYNFDISPYDKGNRENHEPKRIRRLLAHKLEIRRLHEAVSRAGRALVALKGYFTPRQKFKILVGIATGKNQRDKREDIKKRDTDRAIRRAISR